MAAMAASRDLTPMTLSPGFQFAGNWQSRTYPLFEAGVTERLPLPPRPVGVLSGLDTVVMAAVGREGACYSLTPWQLRRAGNETQENDQANRVRQTQAALRPRG
jgi:hypothetical protein